MELVLGREGLGRWALGVRAVFLEGRAQALGQRAAAVMPGDAECLGHYAALACAFIQAAFCRRDLIASSPPWTDTRTASWSLTVPSRIRLASLFCSSDWMTRFKGLAQ